MVFSPKELVGDDDLSASLKLLTLALMDRGRDGPLKVAILLLLDISSGLTLYLLGGIVVVLVPVDWTVMVADVADVADANSGPGRGAGWVAYLVLLGP